MKKEEVLAISKKIEFDEGEEKIESDAFNYGLVTEWH